MNEKLLQVPTSVLTGSVSTMPSAVISRMIAVTARMNWIVLKYAGFTKHPLEHLWRVQDFPHVTPRYLIASGRWKLQRDIALSSRYFSFF